MSLPRVCEHVSVFFVVWLYTLPIVYRKGAEHTAYTKSGPCSSRGVFTIMYYHNNIVYVFSRKVMSLRVYTYLSYQYYYVPRESYITTKKSSTYYLRDAFLEVR